MSSDLNAGVGVAQVLVPRAGLQDVEQLGGHERRLLVGGGAERSPHRRELLTIPYILTGNKGAHDGTTWHGRIGSLSTSATGANVARWQSQFGDGELVPAARGRSEVRS